MMLLLLLLLLNGKHLETRTQIDLIEINHIIAKSDILDEPPETTILTQIIIWNWKPEVCRHHIDRFWIVKDNNLPNKIGDKYYIHHNGIIIKAKILRETKTFNDPEKDDKHIWPFRPLINDNAEQSKLKQELWDNWHRR